MNDLPSTLREFSDSLACDSETMWIFSTLDKDANEIEAARRVIKMAVEYWEAKNRRYKTRYPAWVRASIDIGINPIDWK